MVCTTVSVLEPLNVVFSDVLTIRDLDNFKRNLTRIAQTVQGCFGNKGTATTCHRSKATAAEQPEAKCSLMSQEQPSVGLSRFGYRSIPSKGSFSSPPGQNKLTTQYGVSNHSCHTACQCL